MGPIKPIDEACQAHLSAAARRIRTAVRPHRREHVRTAVASTSGPPPACFLQDLDATACRCVGPPAAASGSMPPLLIRATPMVEEAWRRRGRSSVQVRNDIHRPTRAAGPSRGGARSPLGAARATNLLAGWRSHPSRRQDAIHRGRQGPHVCVGAGSPKQGRNSASGLGVYARATSLCRGWESVPVRQAPYARFARLRERKREGEGEGVLG